MEVEENPDPSTEINVPVEYPKFGERPDTGKAHYLKKKLSSCHLSLIFYQRTAELTVKPGI